MNTAPQLPGTRSSFVSVLAWILIVLAGFTTLIAIAQNILVQVFCAGPQFERAIEEANRQQDLPAFARFMFNNIKLFFAAILLLSAATFVAAIGLLRRRNWARFALIAILGAGIAWNITGIFVQASMMQSMSAQFANAPSEVRSQFQIMSVTMTVFGALMALAFALLFGWIIKRLLSPAIAAEFRSPP